jgi:hypothetical protein
MNLPQVSADEVLAACASKGPLPFDALQRELRPGEDSPSVGASILRALLDLKKQKRVRFDRYGWEATLSGCIAAIPLFRGVNSLV